MTPGLPRRIKLAFLLQAALASIVITGGVLLTGVIVRDSVIQERLDAEAATFWAGRASNPAYPLPQTATLTGYLSPTGAGGRAVPDYMRGLPAGRHRISAPTVPGPGRSPRQRFSDEVVLVETRGPDTFYLSFESGHIDRAIGLTGLVSLLLSLLATYLVTWLTYRTSKRLVAPVSWLAGVVSRWDPRESDVTAIKAGSLPAEAGVEVQQLAEALVGLADRVAEFVQRERDFTRDASHELRTPLTVIRVATDMLLADPNTLPATSRALARVQRAGRDMEAVIDAFLILARESDVGPQDREFDVGEVVREQVERMQPLLADKPVSIELLDEGAPSVVGSPHVLAVMVGNLLSNAAHFTNLGRIQVRMSAQEIVVRDSGIGMDPETLAKAFMPFYRADIASEDRKGMGLAITYRLGERVGWPVSLRSQPDKGTTATIRLLP
ncbi:HAMP domain-containing histidine kinase [Lysobacter sp. H21R4]|uniref:sensor histidine kinase n=1 Tax=Lysobacter sp. H21R4 TaxID=2781021 RepID=UPI001887E267|nr:HAMP domain-containing sensor histidine kinase [Lysobacter sp. H21R4]QOY62325.1 HAMP domain-containing histidine kinase [Lysobacter sp. H21R4]